MKKKNGFTLIELLAVIVILAIIALIATPIVLNLISKARQGAAEDTAYGIRKESQILYQTTLMDNAEAFTKIEVDFTKTMTKNGKTYPETKIFTATHPEGVLANSPFEIDGTLPTNGKVTINGDGTINCENIVINGYNCTIPNVGNVSCGNSESSNNNNSNNNNNNENNSEPIVGYLPENDANTYTQSEFIQNLQVGALIKMVPTTTSVALDGSKSGYSSANGIAQPEDEDYPPLYDVTTSYLNPSELQYWRVIRKNANGTVDVVSEYVSSADVHFAASNGYMNFTGYLNELASAYANPAYVIGSRHMGYGGQTQYITDTSKFYGVQAAAPSTTTTPDIGVDSVTLNSESLTAAEYGNGITGDTLYVTDCKLVANTYIALNDETKYGTTGLQAYKVGTTDGKGYYLPSRRFQYWSDELFKFQIRNITSNGGISFGNTSGYVGTENWGYGVKKLRSIRPILTLKADITSSGTEAGTGAYILG